MVGLVLGGVAIYLVLENRALLLGKAVPDEVEAKFVEVLRGHESVRSAHDVTTRQLTPEAFKPKRRSRSTKQIDALEQAIRTAIPQAVHIDIEVHHHAEGDVL